MEFALLSKTKGYKAGHLLKKTGARLCRKRQRDLGMRGIFLDIGGVLGGTSNMDHYDKGNTPASLIPVLY